MPQTWTLRFGGQVVTELVGPFISHFLSVPAGGKVQGCVQSVPKAIGFQPLVKLSVIFLYSEAPGPHPLRPGTLARGMTEVGPGSLTVLSCSGGGPGGR